MATTAFDGVKPFPGSASQAAPIGHNKPPLDESVIADFEEGLRAVEGLMPRIESLVARGHAAEPCENEDMAGRYGDFLKMARDATARIEAVRETHNRPLLTAQRGLKARADALIGKVNDAASKVKRHLDAYMNEQRRKAEEQRWLAEEQARKAREAAEAEARRQAEEAGMNPATVDVAPVVEVETPAVEEPVVRGDYGSRVGSQTVWRHKILGVRKLPDSILNHEKVVEAIDRVIAAQVRGGARTIKGVEIWPEQITVVR